MTNPFLNPEAIGELGPDFSEAESREHKTIAMLLRADELLAEANMLDAIYSWNRNIGSKKVVPNCAELPFGFSRMRMLPSISDRPADSDSATKLVDREYVKQPSNVLFGVSELYLFVPEDSTDIFRDPDIRTPSTIAIATIDARKSSRIFIVSTRAVIEIMSFSEFSASFTEVHAPVSLPGKPVSKVEFEELHRILFESTVVDQDGREPLEVI